MNPPNLDDPKTRASWRAALDRVLGAWHRRSLLDTDPVGLLHEGGAFATEEVALAAAGLAFGGVHQIRKSIRRMVEMLGGWLLCSSDERPGRLLTGFRHRWVAGEDLAAFLVGARRVRLELGGLEAALLAADDGGPDYLAGMTGLRKEILRLGGAPGTKPERLLPNPAAGSACKRYHLFLRWMIRKDEVDLGWWGDCEASRLLVPMDTHLFRIGQRLGLVDRKNADLEAARQMTAQLRRIDPDDPVKYDFALMRLGMLGGCGSGEPRCSDCPLGGLCPTGLTGRGD